MTAPAPYGAPSTDLIARVPSILEASTAAQAAQDEVVKAEHGVLMAVEFARYALEDYAHRPDIAAVLTEAARELEIHAEEMRLDRLAEAQRDAYDEREAL